MKEVNAMIIIIIIIWASFKYLNEYQFYNFRLVEMSHCIKMCKQGTNLRIYFHK